jgi:octaprenyl-diphosphate synthase
MDALTDTLSQLNTYIISQLKSSIPLLNSLTEHAFQRSGKNIRAQLMIQLAYSLKQSRLDEAFFRTASIIELIHCGTLIHDDVIDQTPTRRGQLATHEVFGNTCSILLGDYLFTKAYLMAQKLPHSSYFFADLAQTAHNLVEGELLQLEQKGKIISLEDYLTIIKLKTSSLFSLACKSVAQLYTPSQQDAFYAIGSTFGIVFQLIDDYQDYFGTQEELKKPPGQDFKERKMTLPLMMLRELGHELLMHGFFETIHSFKDALIVLEPTKLACQELIMAHAKQCEKAINEAGLDDFILPILKKQLIVLNTYAVCPV